MVAGSGIPEMKTIISEFIIILSFVAVLDAGVDCLFGEVWAQHVVVIFKIKSFL